MLAALLALAPVALADSPLTSVDLSAGYDDLPAVKAARASHRVDGTVMAALTGDSGLAEKAAVVSALGWSFDGQHNAAVFVNGLAAARHTTPDALTLKQLTPADRVVLGYLLAMDDYFDLKPLRPGAADLWGAGALDLVTQGAAALPDDFAAQVVRSLVQAQVDMGSSWCAVYQDERRVVDAFPASKRNMRAAAVQSYTDYLDLYASECTSTGPVDTSGAALPADPQLDEIYDVVGYAGGLATATQGGVVLWTADGTATQAHAEDICTNLLVDGAVLWAGCEHRVLMFDGAAWTVAEALTGADDGEAYDLVRGPKGEVLSVRGGDVRRYDAAKKAFVPAKYAGGGYDTVFVGDTEWRIAFLSSIQAGDRTIALGSAEYPGRDPRSFHVAPDGTLYVADFEDGFFRWDGRRFVAVPGAKTEGSDVAWDPTSDVTYWLAYNEGVWQQAMGGAPTLVGVGGTHYLRAVWVDERGNPWIGGDGALVRLAYLGGGRWDVEEHHVTPAHDRR